MHEVVIDGMGDQHFVIEACLNHRDGTRQGVAGVYNRAQYRAQKQTVLQAWSDLVEAAGLQLALVRRMAMATA